MTSRLWIVLMLLGGMLLAFTTYAALIGLAGFVGERFERCPHCHQHGLVFTGRLHPDGCPPGVAEQAWHLLQRAWPHRVHVRHHRNEVRTAANVAIDRALSSAPRICPTQRSRMSGLVDGRIPRSAGTATPARPVIVTTYEGTLTGPGAGDSY